MNDRPLTFQIFPDELCDGLYELPGFLRIPWLTNDGFSHFLHNDELSYAFEKGESILRYPLLGGLV